MIANNIVYPIVLNLAKIQNAKGTLPMPAPAQMIRMMKTVVMNHIKRILIRIMIKMMINGDDEPDKQCRF